MFPVGEYARGGKNECNVQLCVLETDAFMRTAAKHEVVLRVGVGSVLGVEPPFGD